MGAAQDGTPSHLHDVASRWSESIDRPSSCSWRDAASAESLSVTFLELDVRDLAFEGEFDAAICLCQGGFGLLGGQDEPDVFRRIRARSPREVASP